MRWDDDDDDDDDNDNYPHLTDEETMAQRI